MKRVPLPASIVKNKEIIIDISSSLCNPRLSVFVMLKILCNVNENENLTQYTGYWCHLTCYFLTHHTHATTAAGA